MQESRVKTVVIGGGIAGLTAAVALGQAGLPVEVYERAPALTDAGAGLTLWPNALRALRRVGLAEAAIAAGQPVDRSAILTPEGKPLASYRLGEIQQALGEPIIAIHRARLHAILRQALPGGALRTGCACSGFEQDETGVTARFEDGSTTRAGLLIGADGIHSLIRSQLFPGVRLRYAGYTAWRGLVQPGGREELGLTTETWGRGERFGAVPVGADLIYWYATANLPEELGGAPAQEKAELLRRFGRWHAPVPALLERQAAEGILRNDILDFPPMARWSQGRVTLVGDAAHATTPNLGQGACQAIVSAVVLADRIRRYPDDVPAAYSEYERIRRPQSAWVTQTSYQVGRVAQWEHPLASRLRNYLMRLAPRSAFMSQALKAASTSWEAELQ